MKITQLLEDKWGVPTIATKSFKTTDGVKLKLELYTVQKHGTPEAIGLELTEVDSKDPTKWNYGNVEYDLSKAKTFAYEHTTDVSPKAGMQQKFKADIVPLFLNKDADAMKDAFKKASALIAK